MKKEGFRIPDQRDWPWKCKVHFFKWGQGNLPWVVYHFGCFGNLALCSHYVKMAGKWWRRRNLTNLMRETGLEIQIYPYVRGNQDHSHSPSQSLEVFLVVNATYLMFTVCENCWKKMKEEEFDQSDERDWPWNSNLPKFTRESRP